MVDMGILEYSKVINPHSKFCVLHASVFSMNFLCSLNGHHPWEDVEKVAILPKKILANLSINQIQSTQIFNPLASISGYLLKANISYLVIILLLLIENTQNNFIFESFI